MVLPKKILRVKDLTFILPEDFEGDLHDALEEFMKYRDKHKSNAKFVEVEQDKTSVDLLFINEGDDRVFGEYGLFHLIDGSYKIIQGSEPDKEF